MSCKHFTQDEIAQAHKLAERIPEIRRLIKAGEWQRKRPRATTPAMHEVGV